MVSEDGIRLQIGHVPLDHPNYFEHGEIIELVVRQTLDRYRARTKHLCRHFGLGTKRRNL